MEQPKKQYRGESRMDYLTRTAADEQVSEEWSGAVWHVLLGFGLVTAGWIGFLMYLSWKALS
jgi:hypothetical protein